MLTRCPTCETHFRVTAEQLKARSGRVRCGECQQVFNALDTLIEEPLALRRLHDDRLSKDRMDRNLFVKAKVLREFYESGASGGKLSDVVARGRLSKVLHAASRAALRVGRYQQALQLIRQSRQYGNTRLRTAPIELGAMLTTTARARSQGHRPGSRVPR